MEQQEKIYAIRYLSFYYTDEWYSSYMRPSDHYGHISSIFTDKKAAIQEWKRLEYEFSQQVDFYNILYCEPNFNIILDQDDFFANINSEDDWKRILPTAPMDELFELITKLNCHVYGLYEYPRYTKQYIHWNNDKNYHDTIDLTQDSYDKRTNIILHSGFFIDDISLNEIHPSVNRKYASDAIILTGSLSDLSDTPILLLKIIQQDKNLNYDENKKYLTIQPYISTLNRVNALLKKPVQCLTIEEIYQLEKSLN